MSTLSDLRHFIRRHDLLPDGARVVVGVSGGPDSLALLHALNQLAPEHNWQLHVAYLHHGLRPEADDEAHFVAEVASAWGLGCTFERADVRAIAQQPGVALEEAARQARYAFLGRVALRLGVHHVAVGHNADDQAETVLMHLLRGSGLAGLRGMSPSTPLAGFRLLALEPGKRPDMGDLQLVRPLLETPRAEIEAYCQTHGLEPRHDATNTDVTFFRNRLRHQIIPRLQEINPRLTTVLGRTAAVLQGDYDTLRAHRQQLWDDLVQPLAPSIPPPAEGSGDGISSLKPPPDVGGRLEGGELGDDLVQPHSDRVRIDLQKFRQLLPGDQRALLRQAITTLRPDLRNISWEHSERLLDILDSDPQRTSGGPYPLLAGLEAWLHQRWLDILPAGLAALDQPQITQPTVLPLPGSIDLGAGWRLEATQAAWDPGEIPPWAPEPDRQRIWLPLDVAQPLSVRPRQPGDRMNPLGLGGGKAINVFMTDLKLPRAARTHWPLLLDANGEILWLVGERPSESCRLPDDATAAWEIRLETSQ